MIFLSLIDSPEDKTKFERLYNKYYKSMFYVSMRLLHDKFDAEDALQDAFYSIACNMDKIDEVDSAMTASYVVVSVKNASLSILRRRSNSETLTTDIPDEDESVENEAFTDSSYSIILNNNAYKRTIDIIRNMNDNYRIVLYHHIVTGLSEREIAKLLGRNESTVRSQYARGKKMLFDILKREGLI